jgi:dienelactone hydrolase
MTRSIIAVTLACLNFLSCAGLQAAPVTSLANGQTGLIEFTSITPTNIYNMVTSQPAPSITLSGTLTLPSGNADKYPAMVLAHHCGGITATVTNLGNMLNAAGYATFIPDSFTARGYPSGVCTGSTLNNSAAIADALYALKLVATHPKIDAKRIGIIGQSYGGGAVFTTAFEEARQSIISDPTLKFAAHVGLYPTGCSSRYWSANMTGAPILMLLGGADDWTPAPPCQDFANLMTSLGTPTTTVVYPGALHSWDGKDGSYTSNPNWQRLDHCYYQFRMDTFVGSRYDTGEILSGSTAASNYLNSCKQFGASQGGNAAIKAQAEEGIRTFLAQVLSDTPEPPTSTTSMTLRDAIYLYGQGVNAKGDKSLVGVDCDVFELVMDVDSGFTDLAMGQGSSLTNALNTKIAYPDRIKSTDAMFAYALYENQPVKTFTLYDKSNSGSSTQIGTGNAFGYCYSTKATAHVYAQDKAACINVYSDGHTTSCNVADNGTGGGAPTSMTLRDAIYLYGQPINGKGDKILAGENCDVFQVILDVNTGFTDLAMGQGSTVTNAVNGKQAYPDRIYDNASMFSYALYSDQPTKAFIFNDKTAPTSSATTGTCTIFGYCYSTNPNARVYLREQDKCTDKTSNGQLSGIPGC